MDCEGTKGSKPEVKQVVVGCLKWRRVAVGFGSDVVWSMTTGEADRKSVV